MDLLKKAFKSRQGVVSTKLSLLSVTLVFAIVFSMFEVPSLARIVGESSDKGSIPMTFRSVGNLIGSATTSGIEIDASETSPALGTDRLRGIGAAAAALSGVSIGEDIASVIFWWHDDSKTEISTSKPGPIELEAPYNSGGKSMHVVAPGLRLKSQPDADNNMKKITLPPSGEYTDSILLKDRSLEFRIHVPEMAELFGSNGKSLRKFENTTDTLSFLPNWWQVKSHKLPKGYQFNVDLTFLSPHQNEGQGFMLCLGSATDELLSRKGFRRVDGQPFYRRFDGERPLDFYYYQIDKMFVLKNISIEEAVSMVSMYSLPWLNSFYKENTSVSIRLVKEDSFMDRL